MYSGGQCLGCKNHSLTDHHLGSYFVHKDHYYGHIFFLNKDVSQKHSFLDHDKSNNVQPTQTQATSQVQLSGVQPLNPFRRVSLKALDN